MAVYVDILKSTKPYQADPQRKYPYKYFCHLMADSLDELHTFADRLGLQKAWFQNHPKYPHYDITAQKRRMAVRMGPLKSPILS